MHITNGPSDGMADSSGIGRDSSLAHRLHTPFVILLAVVVCIVYSLFLFGFGATIVIVAEEG